MSKIVIIGGMGPQASLALHSMIVKQASAAGSADGHEFPEILHLSIPVPDFISNESRRAEALEMIRGSLAQVRFRMDDQVAIACNTAHLILGDIEAMAGLKLCSMIDSVADRVPAEKVRTVGLLASPTTIKSGLYAEALSARDIDCLLPEKSQQIEIERVIRNVIAGTADTGDASKLEDMANRMIAQGATGIVLGCTELPLIFPAEFKKAPVFNSLAIVADELLKRYNKVKK